MVPVGGQNLEPDMGMRLSLGAPRNLTALLEESLRLDMSRLKLDHSPSRSPMVTRASPSRFNVVTSTPGMEVDKVHSGTESVCRQLALAEIDSGAREESSTSLEREMQGLGLEGEESSEREEVMMEVVVCKITAKTDVVFVSGGGENKNKVSLSLSLMIVNEPLLQGRVVTMDDIGGLSCQKQLLEELVLYPLSSPSITGERERCDYRAVSSGVLAQESSFPGECCCMVRWAWGNPSSFQQSLPRRRPTLSLSLPRTSSLPGQLSLSLCHLTVDPQMLSLYCIPVYTMYSFPQ